jgi:N-methylhydantoinase B/oxoprolinase/acetone carboxylase alpha subunit
MTRAPERVAEDVKNGLVSPQAAERDYKVAVAVDGTIDRARTQALRGVN